MTPHTRIGSRVLLVAIVAAATLLMGAAPAFATELGGRCTNPEAGYTIAFPTGWMVNDHVAGSESDDVAACRFFSPVEFDVRPATQVSGIAVSIGVQDGGPHEAGERATVDGRPATRGESVSASDGFDPAGTRYTWYWVELDDGTWLTATTSDGPNWVGDYADNVATLDAMMDSLEFLAASLPDTALGAPAAGPTGPIGALGLVLVALATGAVRMRAGTAER